MPFPKHRGDSGKCDKENCTPLQKVRSRKHSNTGRNVGIGVLPVEGTTVKGQCLKCCKMSNEVFIAKVLSFEHALYFTLYNVFMQQPTSLL